jgi:hypothetical protein
MEGGQFSTGVDTCSAWPSQASVRSGEYGSVASEASRNQSLSFRLIGTPRGAGVLTAVAVVLTPQDWLGGVEPELVAAPSAPCSTRGR